MEITKNEGWTSTTIYNRILELCEEYGWTMNRLAEMSGMTQSTIYSYRYRNSIPKVETLIAICDALGITLTNFFLVKDDDVDELYVVLSQLSHDSRQLLMEVAKKMKG